MKGVRSFLFVIFFERSGRDGSVRTGGEDRQQLGEQQRKSGEGHEETVGLQSRT